MGKGKGLEGESIGDVQACVCGFLYPRRWRIGLLKGRNGFWHGFGLWTDLSRFWTRANSYRSQEELALESWGTNWIGLETFWLVFEERNALETDSVKMG